MRLLADENVAFSVIAALRHGGYEIFDVHQKKLVGKPDSKLIQFAQRKNAIILTHDKDFLRQQHVPVILLRFNNQLPVMVIKQVTAFLASQLAKKLKKGVVAILSEYAVDFHYPRF